MDFKIATLTKHTALTYDVFELTFETETTDLLYEAGQFVTIKIPQPTTEGNEILLLRSYSISSRPTPGHFELCIKQVENGRGSTYLKSLKPGEKIEFLGPLGHFTFKTSPDKSVLLIATGTGIAPLKSMIEDQLTHQLQSPASTQQFNLIFGARHIKDIFYKTELDALAEKYPNFKYTLTLSQPESEDWEASGSKTGRVTAHIDQLNLDTTSTEVYICGLKDMVLQVTETLQQKGLPKEAVYFERFN